VVGVAGVVKEASGCGVVKGSDMSDGGLLGMAQRLAVGIHLYPGLGNGWSEWERQ
jgi:hypothetical protein